MPQPAELAPLPKLPETLRPKRLAARITRWWQVVLDLFFIRWSNIRNEWYFHILAPIFPLAMLTFMRLVGAIPDPERAFYMTVGNAILILALGPMQSLSNDLAIARQRHDLEFFATLPFSKLQFILAYSAVTAIPSIPAMLATIIIGSIWFGFPIVFNPLVLLILLASSLSMAGIGVLFGTYARNIHHANMLNTIAQMTIMFVSPIMIPWENLPRILQWTSRLLPPSYAADGLRAALAGNYGSDLWFNTAMLLLFTSLLLTLGIKKLSWRES